MKYLRHPLRAVSEPFGKAGLLLAVVALVAALGGGAYAASGGLNGKQKKEVEKIAKKEAQKYSGKQGPAGPAGTPGGKGENGTGGANGTNGKDGTNGTNGESVTIGSASAGECANGGSKFSNSAGSGHVCNGTSGKSVVVGTATSGPAGECEAGGATVEVSGEAATKKAVCDGKAGESGFTEALPPGKTETGNWAFPVVAYEGFTQNVPISFSIPLAEPSENVVVLSKQLTEESADTPPPVGAEGCEYEVGNTGAIPVAPAGTLCVFTIQEEAGNVTSITTPTSVGDRVTGAYVRGANPEGFGTPEELAQFQLAGVWAVTAGAATP